MTVTFEDLPIDVLEKVVEKTTLFDCLTLRKVCKDLRNLVDSSEFNCDSIGFTFTNCSCIVKFKDLTLGYVRIRDGGCEISSFNSATSVTKIYRDDRDYKQAFIADTSTFLNNRKLKIDHLSLFFKTPAAATECSEFLKSLKSPLNVRTIEGENLEYLHLIVPLLKQEKLEEIIFKKERFDNAQLDKVANSDASAILENPKLKIDRMYFGEYSYESVTKFSKNLMSMNPQIKFGSIYIWGGREEWVAPASRSLNPENVEEVVFEFVQLTLGQFSELAGMEQWKKRMSLFYCDLPHMNRLEHFVDFKKFEFKEAMLTDETLVTIRDRILKSPHLRQCRLVYFRKISEDEVYEMFDRIFGQDPAYDAQTLRFTIPGSRDFFQLCLDECRRYTMEKLVITIKRTSEH